MYKNASAFLAELIGTFCVVLLAAGAVCATRTAVQSGTELPQVWWIVNALAYGLAYAVALAAVLPRSQGFLNPAITLMLWVYKRLDGFQTVLLIAMQLLGAVLAGAIIRFAFPLTVLEFTRVGTPSLNVQIFDLRSDELAIGIWPSIYGIVWEFGLTFILTFVVFATLVDSRFPRAAGPRARWLAPFWVGIALFAIVLVGFPFSGAAVNPARWFGTVVFERSLPTIGASAFRDHVVYWFGPVAGALVAGGLYTTLFLPQETEAPAVSNVAQTKSPAAASALVRGRK